MSRIASETIKTKVSVNQIVGQVLCRYMYTSVLYCPSCT